ncbi:sodium bicarbonate cotransporter 3- hypothetical protein [Limosa lapponica baueri]|uniref:Sodium bicarbonate cotransporter 3 n=1 Tax=Limosa lapponica baueri TaxID=1758121 RepID=A0A2I0UK33_LIMLA|nr:sodium bicarbonate cotransporter 3- hypothetical protein [Limosa lapponica baueri]
MFEKGHDEEAVVDMGKISSTINTNFEKEELENWGEEGTACVLTFISGDCSQVRTRSFFFPVRKRKATELCILEFMSHLESKAVDGIGIVGTGITEEKKKKKLIERMAENLHHMTRHPNECNSSWVLKMMMNTFPMTSSLKWMNFASGMEKNMNGKKQLDMVLDNMIASGQLDESIRENVREALLKRHHHQNEKKFSNRIPLVRSFADIGKKHSDPHLLERNGLLASPQSAPGNLDTGKSGDVKGTGTGGSRENSTVDFSKVFHDVAYKAKDRNDLLSGIDEFLDQVTVLPPGEWDPSIRIEPPKSVPSQEKRKVPKFPNGSTPIGETLKEEGHHAGPELERTGRDYDLSYLSLRTSIGLWTAFLCIVLVATDASSLVCYITRFTEEAFAALICIIFIYEALEKLFHLGEVYAFNMHNDLDKLTLYSVEGMLGVQFKTKRYFPTKVRSTISDFAVFLTIVIMVLIDYLVGVPSPKLHVPEKFEPTRKDRGWFIDPLGRNPWWTLLIAAVPALLCTILIFMDQQITAVIINRKEHKLKKGCGYHLDLLMVGIMLGICSIMGLPWFVAATVLSISHVNSLKVESECSAPGEQPKFLGIREQRVTGLMIFVMMGLSVFMTSVLKFFDRIKLFGMPAKHQPDLIYLRYVPLWKVHIFTVVQLTCLVLLWVIKASAAAVVFPMMVLALVFVRKLMDLCFTKRELSWLDDLMPESKKKKEDDKKKKEKAEAERMLHTGDNESVHLAYGEANLDFPVKTLKYSLDPSIVNISDEMAKTAQWKALAMSTENAKVTRANLR